MPSFPAPGPLSKVDIWILLLVSPALSLPAWTGWLVSGRWAVTPAAVAMGTPHPLPCSSSLVLTSSSLPPSERPAPPNSSCRIQCTCRRHRAHPVSSAPSPSPKSSPFWSPQIPPSEQICLEGQALGTGDLQSSPNKTADSQSLLSVKPQGSCLECLSLSPPGKRPTPGEP